MATSISNSQLRSLLEPLSHDLKNQLTPLSLYLQILQKKVNDPTLQQTLVKMEKSITTTDQYITLVGEIFKTVYETHVVQVRATPVFEIFALTGVELEVANQDQTVLTDSHKLKRVLGMIALLYQSSTLEKSIKIKSNTLELIISGEKIQAPKLPAELIFTYVDVVVPLIAESYTNTEKSIIISLKFD